MANANSTLAKTRITKRWAAEERKLIKGIDARALMGSTKPIKKTVSRMVRVSDGIVRCRRAAINY